MWQVFKFIFGGLLVGAVIKTRNINIINLLAFIWGVYLVITSFMLFWHEILNSDEPQ